ncbi:hypothetical protein PN441_05030 [Spirulina major CS-329]|uniref:hypothetical protein n=1 Tax=Spirulina TaxID=1154 RepID=UPI00232AE714|nr:hypothetical protein [Spirulina major]MDB9502427.1 hypothetical protein [Spirulina major CS-329]
MTSLSHLSGIRQTDTPPDSGTSSPSLDSAPSPQPKRTSKKSPRTASDKLVTVNIKINKSDKEWLAATASRIRENNADPVPPNQRVYPQHLIGVAIAVLKQSDVNWDEVQNIQDLREQLNLLDH